MSNERVFDESVDTEHTFVLQYDKSEQMFERGGGMSVALELEYQVDYPRLRVVPRVPGRVVPSTSVQRRRILLVAVVVVLLVLLMLPLRALGGQTIAGSVPTAGQEYVVRSGDTIASIAARVDGTNVAGMERRLAAEAGSTVVVPGEHLLIP